MDLGSIDDELEYEKKVAAGGTISNDTSIFNGKLSHSFRKDDDNDSDADTFGEASDNCEPDQNYLDELLHECHPERLNLLDYSYAPRVPSSDDGTQNYDSDDDDDESYQRKTRRRNGLVSSRARRGLDYSPNNSVNRASDSDSDEDENDFPPPWSSSRLGSDTSAKRDIDKEDDDVCHGRRRDDPARDFDSRISPIRYVPEKDQANGRYEEVQCGVTEDSSAPEESEDGAEDHYDVIGPGAPTTAGSPRRRLKDQYEQMGKSGKKSFRQVSRTTFWSQPFKGLGRPKRRGKLGDVDGEEVSP